MNIDDTITIIKNKFNYTESQSELLKTIINNMINYYGEDFNDKIINTFLEVPIIYVNDKEDLQKKARALGVKEEYKLPLFAGAAYEEYYQKDANEKIERIPFIIIKTYHNKEDYNAYITTIIHEMCHAVMNKDKQIIDGDKIYSKTGMIEDIITFNEGKQTKKTSNIGIEEGMNEYDARIIAEMILGEKSNSTAYNMLVNYVSSAMNNEILRKIINTSRMNGDNEWKKTFGDELANEFVDSLINYYNLLFDKNISKEQKEILKEEYMKKNIEAYKKMMNFSQNYDDYQSNYTR